MEILWVKKFEKGYFILFILFLTCMMRVDWDNLDKPKQIFDYDHPHDGNLTKAEIAKNPNTSSGEKGCIALKPWKNYMVRLRIIV